MSESSRQCRKPLPVIVPRISSAMLETRIDIYNYNVRNELISADKLVGRDACLVEAFGEGRAPIAPQAPTSTVEYAYQYDDIGNRITSLDLGTNRTYTANNLNQYSEISTSDAGLQTPEFDLWLEDGRISVFHLCALRIGKTR